MTNPLTLIPSRVRLALYLLWSVLGPVLIYTESRGWTGPAEYQLWIGLGAVLGLTAASNTPTAADEVDSPA